MALQKKKEKWDSTLKQHLGIQKKREIKKGGIPSRCGNKK